MVGVGLILKKNLHHIIIHTCVCVFFFGKNSTSITYSNRGGKVHPPLNSSAIEIVIDADFVVGLHTNNETSCAKYAPIIDDCKNLLN